MQLSYKRIESWPKLAWLAKLTPGSGIVHVWHGPQVETRNDWFCEAIWAGEFEAGDFDLTERVFGTGGRVRGERIMFVSPGSTVDRILHAEVDGASWVSNSLACVMTQLDAKLDPTNDRYYHFFGSMVCGIRRYARELKTSIGPVRVTIFQNQEWDGQKLVEREKPYTVRGFKTFDEYHGFLDESIRLMSENLASPARSYRYRMLGTISSGYDSATVSTLSAKYGLREVIAFSPSRNGWPDSGDAVAEALGLELKVFDRRAWCTADAPEYLFIAADAKGQDIFFHGAGDLVAGRALMTGFSGDMTWEEHDAKGQATLDDMPRTDRSGLSLTEYRLHVGSIHCPIPYLGARFRPDIYAISRSEEMKPWDIGGKYNRPIPRRILEAIGVPRGSFGTYKRGSSVLWFEKTGLHAPHAMKEYHRWLRRNWRAFVKAGRFPPHIGCALLKPIQKIASLGWTVHSRTKNLPKPLRFIDSIARRVGQFSSREYLAQYMFPWALERTQRHYTRQACDGGEPAEQNPPESAGLSNAA